MRVIRDAHLARKHVTNMLQCVPSYEYLWGAAWCFFEEGDPAAERWVQEKARAVLEGNASTVAAAIRRKATRLGLEANRRENADTAADYLLAKRPYLDYPSALANG
jgi:triphosphoribosyl-dephospho-CoA synthetase